MFGDLCVSLSFVSCIMSVYFMFTKEVFELNMFISNAVYVNLSWLFLWCVPVYVWVPEE